MNALAGRIAPASNDELATAIHEAGHAVFCQILPNMNGMGRASIWKESKGWTGFVCPNDCREAVPYDDNADEGFPPIATTMPSKWREKAGDAWSTMLVAFAGAAAESIFDRDSLDAQSIRWHPSTEIDLRIATKIATHFFAAEFVDSILDRAAETAGLMCQVPLVWSAINDIAAFLTDNGRNQSSIFETSVIVRRYFPQQIEPPSADLAMAFIRKQS